MVLMNLVVYSRSSLQPQCPSENVAQSLGPELCTCFLVSGAELQNMVWGLWACFTWTVNCVRRTVAIQMDTYAVGKWPVRNRKTVIC